MQRVIKVMHSDSAEHKSRFAREAGAISRVSKHPNIVTIHKLGEHAGQPYIMMEFIAGESLEEKLKRDKFIPEKEKEI